MSINRVSYPLLPHYGPLAAANNSPPARPAAIVGGTADTTAAREPVTPAASSNSDPGDLVESTLDRALRQARIATGTSPNEERNSGNGRYAPGIGLYRRVSQYNDDRSSGSGLMKSWNDIVRENRFEDAGVASYMQAVSQNDAVHQPARVLHLTV